MRAAYYTLVIVGCLVAFWHMLPFRVFWAFDRIEQRSKKVITAAELQAWATNLLAQYTTNAQPKVSELGTNFPPQLSGIYRNPPYIQINEESTNYPACVFLTWGGGVIGHCGFEIGPTNFVSYRRNARAWQAGVYFWSDEKSK